MSAFLGGHLKNMDTKEEIKQIKDRLAKLEANLDYTIYDIQDGEATTTYGNKDKPKRRKPIQS